MWVAVTQLFSSQREYVNIPRDQELKELLFFLYSSSLLVLQ